MHRVAVFLFTLALTACASGDTDVAPGGQPSGRLVEGALCGDPRLEGRTIEPVSGKIEGCGIAEPVEVASMSGVVLSQPARLNCETARRLADWVEGASGSAEDRLGAPLSEIRVAASYVCRTRNGRPGARLSAHAQGRAMDISGVTLDDGRRISVLKGWRAEPEGAYLREIWRAACGPFRTVLGPESDARHRDHFHLDLALTHRQPYCR